MKEKEKSVKDYVGKYVLWREEGKILYPTVVCGLVVRLSPSERYVEMESTYYNARMRVWHWTGEIVVLEEIDGSGYAEEKKQ